MNCPYRSNISQGFSMSNFQMTNEKSAVFSLPFSQTKQATPLASQALSFNVSGKPATALANQPSLNVSGLGLPEDGQKMITDLMSFCHSNLQREKTLNSGNVNLIGSQNLQQQHVNAMGNQNQQQQRVNVMGNQNQQQQHVNVMGNQYHHQQQQKQKFQFQMDDNFYGQGVLMRSNVPGDTSMPMSTTVFQPAEIQFDQCKTFESTFKYQRQ